METIFWKRFTELCEEKGVKPHAVMVKLNLNTGNPTAWKNGRMPGAKALEKIASEVGCQIEYLLGKTDARENKISPAHDGAELTEQEFNLLDAFSEIDGLRAAVQVKDELIDKLERRSSMFTRIPGAAWIT